MLDFDDVFPMAALKVLVIEDDVGLGLALAETLELSGMRTMHAATGTEALALKRSFVPDIALVDLNLPDTDGLTLLTILARQGDCGLIIVSGMSDDADRITGLEMGADDYVCKPPHPRELLARIRAVHRRVKLRAAVKATPAAPPVLCLGSIKIELQGRTVHRADGARIRLTAAEFAALETLLAANGQAVSRDCLSLAALHHPWRAEDRGVDQLIFTLRQKLADRDEDPLIHSVRGMGYMVSDVSNQATPHQEALVPA